MYDKNVLCVDDNEDSRELLKIFFELENYQVVTCATHQECSEQVKNNEFSAIVLDSWIPGLSGVDICRQIRAVNTTIPIIFYSADALAKSREKGLQAGANAYLVKPDDLNKVVSTVTELIEELELKK